MQTRNSTARSHACRSYQTILLILSLTLKIHPHQTQDLLPRHGINCMSSAPITSHQHCTDPDPMSSSWWPMIRGRILGFMGRWSGELGCRVLRRQGSRARRTDSTLVGKRRRTSAQWWRRMCGQNAYAPSHMKDRVVDRELGECGWIRSSTCKHHHSIGIPWTFVWPMLGIVGWSVVLRACKLHALCNADQEVQCKCQPKGVVNHSGQPLQIAH